MINSVMPHLRSVLPYLLYPALALFSSLVLTRLAISFLPQLGFIDLPDARRIHTKPTPRGGGIAIIISYFLFAFLCAERHFGTEHLEKLLLFLFPSCVILVAGLLDDRFSLSSRLKLCFQIVAGGIVWWVGARFDTFFGWSLPDYLSLPFTILWVVLIVNAFNLIDGMDGLASGLALLSCLCLAIWGGLFMHQMFFMMLALIMAGCCFGFLRYNFSPASIFLGDTGSMFLGLFFAYMSLTAIGRAATLTTLVVPVLAIGVPIFDVTLAFWRRLVRKMLNPKATGIMTADCDHLHHRLLRENGSPKQTAWQIYQLAILVALFGFIVTFSNNTAPMLGYAALLVLAILIIRRLAGLELYNSVQLILKQGLKRPNKMRILLVMMPFIDIAVLFCALLWSFFLTRLQPENWFGGFLCIAAPVILSLAFSGCYRTLWIRSRICEVYYLCECLLMGMLFSAYLFYVLFVGETNLTLPAAAFFIFCSTGGIGMLLYRMFLMYVGTRLLWQLYQHGGVEPSVPIVLLGGGVICNTYLTSLYGSGGQRTTNPVGIIDENPVLHGMRLYGLPVLGGLDVLEDAYAHLQFRKLVITPQNISLESRTRLEDFCREHQIELIQFHLAESAVGQKICRKS